MLLHTIRRLNNKHVNFDRWHFSSHQMAILLARVVPRVEQAHTGYLHHEHACADDVPCIVAPEFDALDLDLLMVINACNAVDSLIDILVCVERCARLFSDARHLDKVRPHQFADCSGGVCHVHFSFERGFGEKIRHGCCMVHVKVGDEQDINRVRIHFIEEGQRLIAAVPRVGPAVEHDGLAFELEEAAGAANLVARSQRDKLQRLIALEGIRSLCAALRHGDIGNWHARRQYLDSSHSR
mmetsp:Transcript_64159/g.103674  ORF Transcript_64159/g.103674 Transcript_64159/m.103674 type:complete len:240 (-) Transcript_64159:117-836(-)